MTEIVFSLGTIFFKNYYYISNKCKKIIVFVTTDHVNNWQYHNALYYFKSIKSTNFTFIVIDDKDKTIDKVHLDFN